MVVAPENFGRLHFTEATFGAITLDGDVLRIEVRGLPLLGDHPLATEDLGVVAGDLVFKGVSRSRRTISEYIGDPKAPDGFKPRRELVDVDRARVSGQQEYVFEGVQTTPVAWVDWVIVANQFELQVKTLGPWPNRQDGNRDHDR